MNEYPIHLNYIHPGTGEVKTRYEWLSELDEKPKDETRYGMGLVYENSFLGKAPLVLIPVVWDQGSWVDFIQGEAVYFQCTSCCQQVKTRYEWIQSFKDDEKPWYDSGCVMGFVELGLHVLLPVIHDGAKWKQFDELETEWAKAKEHFKRMVTVEQETVKRLYTETLPPRSRKTFERVSLHELPYDCSFLDWFYHDLKEIGVLS